MKIPAGSVALVTGANRSLGRHFAQQLLQRGAATVYATARIKAALAADPSILYPQVASAA